MSCTDAETGFSGIAANAECCALCAFFCEIIGFAFFDVPCVAFVKLDRTGFVEHFCKLVGGLEGGGRIIQKVEKILCILFFHVHDFVPVLSKKYMN